MRESRAGDRGACEHRRRMGRWKARVERVTRERKKRYCRIRGWAWRRVAFVGGLDVWGVRRGSFSMRAHVR